LRVLDELQPDHLRVLAAITTEPDGSDEAFSSILQTLNARLPDLPTEHIRELVEQLERIAVTNIGGALSALMTPGAAVDLRSRLTPFGHRFVGYIADVPSGG
jgi:hypothetical protein